MKRGEVQDGQRFRYVYASGKSGAIEWIACHDEQGQPQDRWHAGRFDDVDPEDAVTTGPMTPVEQSVQLVEESAP